MNLHSIRNAQDSASDLLNPEISESDLFAFFEKTPDLVCIADRAGFFKKINSSVIAKLGFTREELFSRPISSFIYPEDRDITSRNRTKLLAGNALLNFENRYMTKEGGIVWLEWTSIYMSDKDVVFAIAKDVTQRKIAENEIQEKYKKFKSLAIHFKGSIEEDRKHLATELHEELAQIASIVKMDVDWMAENLNELPEEAYDKIQHAQAVAELLINSIRRISFSISPNMLELLGLNATLAWLCKDFSILNSIPCSFRGSYNESDLSTEIRIDFFRICQESLMNVMYHAQANNVYVSIEDKGDRIVLFVVDDGIGFDTAQSSGTNGLTAMRERANSINGQLTIESEIGGGTKISLAVEKKRRPMLN